MLQFTKDDIMRGIELGVMALLALLAMLLIVRPMLRRIMSAGRGPGRAGRWLRTRTATRSPAEPAGGRRRRPSRRRFRRHRRAAPRR